MKPAIINGACRLRGAHCAWCLTHPEWRTQVGTPEECPHGITLETAAPPTPGEFRMVYRVKGCGTCAPKVVVSKA